MGQMEYVLIHNNYLLFCILFCIIHLFFIFIDARTLRYQYISQNKMSSIKINITIYTIVFILKFQLIQTIPSTFILIFQTYILVFQFSIVFYKIFWNIKFHDINLINFVKDCLPTYINSSLHTNKSCDNKKNDGL